ncbi:MAG TPA: sigma-70 family RNA polymerase sigma factor [Longimicrobiales bacterium]|nr:sigma-70 family RNA polymerase sigma factor [Longimicrobiales bacterium]
MTDWAEVYRTTFTDLVRYLHRKVWDADRARDLAQEAFARALDRGPSDGAVQNPRAWLFRVATNLAHDEARAAARRRRHLTLLKDEATPSSEPDPIERMEQEAREHAARQALAQLTDRDRDALLLWDAGMTYTEIAAQTGLAVGAVGTTLARARRRLVEAHGRLHAAARPQTPAQEVTNAARG